MAESTKIQWCHHTFNPFRGCVEVHAGCDNCYARTLSKRNPKTLGVWGPQGTRVVAAESQWKAVERWNREAGEAGERRRVFCASLADVFEDWQGMMRDAQGNCLWHRDDIGIVKSGGCTVDMSRGERWATMADVRARLFRLIDDCQNLDFLLVTKRPENVRKFWPRQGFPNAGVPGTLGRYEYRENVWLLTSVSDQQTADAMIPELLKCRDLVPVLGISAEPLLEYISLSRWMRPPQLIDIDPGDRDLDWVIVGGESGPAARPCRLDWIQSIVDQCWGVDTPVFVKQLGSRPYIDDSSILGAPFDVSMVPTLPGKSMIDPKGGDPLEWPDDLRVRQFPEVPQ